MTESSTFTNYQLDTRILKALEEMQYKEPSYIQEKAIPLILARQDLLGLAKTGSGKTAACAIPICQMVDTEKKEIQALIIVPTRELAMQYAHEAQKIGKYKGVKAFALCGGEEYTLQQSKIKAGVQVLVATPGRLIDFIYSRSIDLSSVKTLILDEADEMLSMGFIDDLDFIIQCLIQEHQTLLFSATMPKNVKTIADKYLKEPSEIHLKHEDATPQKIIHKFLYCHHADRDEKLKNLIKTMAPHQAVIFCHSRIQVEKVADYLKRHLDQVDLLHAGFSQDIRTIVTSKFRKKAIRYLVATDVIARGLDFSGISHVFIYELSQDLEIYVHRSGRTGRFDKEGTVVTLVTKRELNTAKKLESRLHAPLSWIEEPPRFEPSRPLKPVGGPRRIPRA